MRPTALDDNGNAGFRDPARRNLTQLRRDRNVRPVQARPHSLFFDLQNPRNFPG